MMTELQLEQLKTETGYGLDLFMESIARAPDGTLDQLRRQLEDLFETAETLELMALWSALKMLVSVVRCELSILEDLGPSAAKDVI